MKRRRLAHLAPSKLHPADVAAAITRHLTVPGTGEPLMPYPEQLRGGRALLRGAIAEMATGEGKTITAAFAAAVWAREGPVHVATANAYLAARDAAWLEPVYADLGLRTGVITPDTPPAQRREQYGRDIVYSTLAEFGFDYLRDQLVTRVADRVQVRGLGALIVDEADLLLIDEARTPLVIAHPAEEAEGPDLVALAPLVAQLVVEQADRVADKLERLRTLPPRSFEAAVLAAQVRRGAPRDPAVLAFFRARPDALRAAERAERELGGTSGWMLDDGLLYSIDERARTAYFTETGQQALEQRLGPVFADAAAHGLTLTALHSLVLAYALFERDRDYLVREGRVVLIEESTGRAAESRRYLHGLHTAIEVKELGAPLQETETLAQISVQQFVRLYRRCAGMTGTAHAAREEFGRLYAMDVVSIPRHRPNRRVDLPPRLYRTAAEVDRAVVAEVAAAHARGQPVLVGTRDVARSERLSALLTEAGLPHAVLNAREHAREAEIVAGAGRLGAITIATNMAGRGTDICLAPGLEAALVARAVAELRRQAVSAHVLVTCASPHAFRRLRDALHAAGLETTTLHEDHRLVVRPAACGTSAGCHPSRSDAAAPLLGSPCAMLKMTHRGPVPRTLPSALHTSYYEFALGLYVIAVEPQPSRRLDDQLRGRSGRQGDEGVTRLYASLDDETLRFYAAAGLRARALRALMRRPCLEGRAAQRIIDDAQRRAERLHYGQRRVLFEFDQVLETQRQTMLAARDRALTHPDPDAAVRSFIPRVAAGEVARCPADPAQWPAWVEDLCARYGLGEVPGDLLHPRTSSSPSPLLSSSEREDDSLPRPATEKAGWKGDRARWLAAGKLAALLDERYEKARAETGHRWPELVRAALLRAAAELWARHVGMVDHRQRQAPVVFGFLPAPVVVNFAREASRLYVEYVQAVQAETLSTLLTLPQPYERPLPALVRPPLSAAAVQLLHRLRAHTGCMPSQTADPCSSGA